MGGPTGTVTFFFSDVEGSTRLWDTAPDAMREALALHDRIVRGAIEAHGGVVFATGGDGFAAAFGRAADALAAASDAQAALGAEPWPDGAPIRVRMGLHTGEVEERDGDYFGPAVNRAARIMAAGHGGQVLVSSATAAVLASGGLADLGEHSFAGLSSAEHVYQAGAGDFPPLRSLSAPSNLPTDRSAFIGRDRELAAVAGLVRSQPITTLTGVGGVGKTRLAVQAAAGMAGEFPGGVWLAELAPLVDGQLVAAAVASAIGAPVSPGLDSTEVVCRFVAQRRALIVLDNCEHVVATAASLVDAVLGRAPRVRVLVTSREPLGLPGEAVWRVPSLNVEDDAVELFSERASHVRPGFALERTTHEAVVAVCRRLDGIPLAIELAAARAKVLSVEQIAARLDERFRLLTRGGRTAVPRQQTLQGAIDWSYELLSQPERELFDSLGVFAGEFDLAAVAAVVGIDDFEALDLVEQLADKSMLEVDASSDRYRLLETLRQYAWDRLIATGRLGAARDAHARHYSVLAREQASLMRIRGRQVEALDRLEADYDNLRTALAYLIESRRAEDAARMVRRVAPLLQIRHPREGFGWFQQVVAIAEGLPPDDRAKLLGDASHAAHAAGDFEEITRYASAAIDVAGDDAPAVALWTLSQSRLGVADYKGAAELARKALQKGTAAGDLLTQSMGTGVLAEALMALGQEEEARVLVPELIGAAEELGNPTVTAAAYMMAADVAALADDRSGAADLFHKGMDVSATGGPIVMCGTRIGFAMLTDDLDAAREAVLVSLATAKDQLSGYYQFTPLLAAVRVLLLMQRAEVAARVLGAYRSHAAEDARVLGAFQSHPIAGTRVGWVSPGRWSDIVMTTLTEALAGDVLDEELQRGGQLSVDQALQLALDELRAPS